MSAALRPRFFVWLLLGASALFALGMIALQWKLHQSPPLEKIKTLPDFRLTERSGQTVALADLKGKVWLADFIYTTCPGPCPMLSSHLAALQKSALQNPEVRFVSISTNPETDTTAVLQQYAERFHAGDHWLFLTGDKGKVQELIRTGFLLAIADQNDAKNPVVHSTKLALVDKNGVIRKYFDGQSDEANDEILHDIDRLTRE